MGDEGKRLQENALYKTNALRVRHRAHVCIITYGLTISPRLDVV
jgi:hypothetical protein